MFDAHATEQAVLGGLLFHQDFYTKHSDKLSSKLFDDWKHRLIFDAVKAVAESDQPPDLTTVAEKLGPERLDEIGGPFYLLGCHEQGVRLNVAENHVQRLVEHAKRRDVQRSLMRAMDSLDRGEDTQRVVEIMMASLHDGTLGRDGIADLDTISDAVMQSIFEQEQTEDGRTSDSGIATGFSDVDAVTGGYGPGQLWVLSAYPAQGKSAWALASTASVSQRFPVLYFSLEMSIKELMKRLLVMRSKVEGERIKHASAEQKLTESEWKRLAEARDWVSSLSGRLNIEETCALTVGGIASAVERWNSRAKAGEIEPLRLVVTDYLQLMDLKGETVEHSVAQATKMLKRLALRWTNAGMPLTVLCLSQLVKPQQQDMKEGVPPRPNLRDIRGSGQVVADADVVAFLYRIAPFLKVQGRDYDPSLNRTSEYIIAKQRDGPVGIVNLRFDESYSLFSNII